MDVLLVYRSKKCKLFSIENVFNVIQKELADMASMHIVSIYLPFESNRIYKMVLNSIFVWFKSFKYQIVHVTGDAHYCNLLVPRRKNVLTIHDTVMMQRGSGIKLVLLKYLWMVLPIRKSAYITTISQKTLIEVTGIVGPLINSSVIENPLRPELLVYHPQEESCKPRILHIGTNPNKNLERVIQSLVGIDCLLVIVGSINERIAKLLSDNNVEFEVLRELTNQEIHNQYVKCSVVSFPSLYEGFGMPIIEGQSIGRIVVTSNIEPMVSVSSGCAILVDPNAIDSIRSGFQKALKGGPDCKLLVENGVKASMRFRPSFIATQYLDVYKRVVV